MSYDTITPQTLHTIQDCALATHDPASLVEKARQMQDQGTMAGTGRMSEVEQRHWYGVAADLCDQGGFSDAFPIALNLQLYAPPDPRHTFLLGSCLQRLGHPREAAGYFALSTYFQSSAAASFRLGECLVACGEIEDGIRAFDQCAALARGISGLESLRECALDNAHAMRPGRPRAGQEAAAEQPENAP